MPNYCNNVIKITGEKAELNRLKEFVKGDNIFDLEKVIPLTETKTKAKLLWEKLTAEEQKDRWENDFDSFWFNNGGYDWCRDNWGTKWNVCDCEEPQETESELIYIFDTAWSPCAPITICLIEKFPKLKFTHDYNESGSGFQGILEGENGKVNRDDCWDIDINYCPECDICCISVKGSKKFKCQDCEKFFNKKDMRIE